MSHHCPPSLRSRGGQARPTGPLGGAAILVEQDAKKDKANNSGSTAFILAANGGQLEKGHFSALPRGGMGVVEQGA